MRWVRHGEAQSSEGGKDQRRVTWSHDQGDRAARQGVSFQRRGACGMSSSPW